MLITIAKKRDRDIKYNYIGTINEQVYIIFSVKQIGRLSSNVASCGNFTYN